MSYTSDSSNFVTQIAAKVIETSEGSFYVPTSSLKSEGANA